VIAGIGNFEPLPWVLRRSKKFDLNGSKFVITSRLDINNKKYRLEKNFTMIFESVRLLLLIKQ
jgi:hypothetical protein